ncbi:MAG: hypothetical protein JJU42_05990 [Rhodobacteraceae bacterium]|nr:hypothetical protein [Paracoccaceae bacterium]
MRSLSQGDIAAAARVLLTRPEAERPVLLRRMLAEAQAADRYRRRHGRVHPGLGNGTLMAAALARGGAAAPDADAIATLRAMAQVIDGVLDWHAARDR